METTTTTKQRRRGVELEQSILESAWTELVDRGYPGLTMENVASRAGTSRSVLARRWDDKFSLAISTIRHQKEKYPLEVTDRGDLRAELLEYLNCLSKRATMISVVVSLLFSECFQTPHSPPEDLRAALIEGEKNVLSAIYQRAVERGEIDPGKLNPPVERLLVDLFRHHAIMTLSAPSPALRKTWVDTIFLPIVRTT